MALREAYKGPLRNAGLCEAFLSESLSLLFGRALHVNLIDDVLGVAASCIGNDVSAYPFCLAVVLFGILAQFTCQA